VNEIGVVVLGAVARGTAFAGIGWVFCLLLRRRGPSASAMIALATLVGMVGVSALGVSPWPRWWSLETDRSDRTLVKAEVPPKAIPLSEPINMDTRSSDSPALTIEASRDSATDPAETGLGLAFRDLGQALMRAPAASERPGWGWRAWIAVGAIVGVGMGVARFALGLAAVSMLRRRSRAVDDPSMRDLASEIETELGIDRAVGIRVAPGLATPATVGWRRPVILLPEDWTEWDSRERRVVLAHEMAHILRNDYFSGLWAQFCLALHYYHPLAHWLAGRLRLDQELAADAWGARLAGGSRTYLTTLARMALRNDPRPVGWPARSFRPARGTFLRRIEMLRDMNEVRTPAPLPRRARWVTFGLLFVAGLAIASFRGPGSIKVAEAAPLPPPPEAASGATIEHGFIPAETAMIAVARPADLLANPEVSRFIEGLEPIQHLQTRTHLKAADVEQVTLLWTSAWVRDSGPPLAWAPSAAIFRMTKPQDWKAILTKNIPELKEARFGDLSYYQLAEGPKTIGFSTPDGQTLVIAEEPFLFRVLTSKPGAADRSPWADAWKTVKKGQVAVAVDVTALLVRLHPRNVGRPEPPVSPFGLFAPLLERANAYAISVDATRTIAVDGIATCNTDDNARQVSDTLKAVLTLGRNALESARGQNAANLGGIKLMIDFGVPFLEKANITTEKQSVHLSAASDLQLAQAFQLIAGPVQTQRDRARNAQSINNLKQIGLAFHNYNSANDKFPAAAILGPDGKPPHSWRVAILPYIEQNDLYQQYKFDEPWDSPSNRKLLDKMPVIYRHPLSKSTTSASYFVFTGKETLFPGNEGSKLADITDGTSNTILAVEANQDIPWTKPEDLPFDPNENQRFPKLGGFIPGPINVLMADGSVRRLKETISPIVLKALITRAGGEVIDSSAY